MDVKILAGVALVALAFAYMQLGMFGVVLVLGLAGFTYYKMNQTGSTGNPLEDFKYFLEESNTPPSWRNTVVFCVAHLAEQTTGFRPGKYGITEFPSQSGVNAESIIDYVRYCADQNDSRSLDNDCSECPGIGNATATKLKARGIVSTRQLLKKFNTFSGLSIKSKYL